MSSSVPTPRPSSSASSTLPSVDGDDLHAARQRGGNRRQRLFDAGVVEQVALVEHDEIGAGDLVLKDFLDRIVVIERRVGGALRERFEIVRDAAVGERRAIDHDDDAVDGDAALDRRPVERLHQRLRQREAGGFDDDVLDAAFGENGIERRHELVGDRAAQAAVGELDDVVFRAGFVAAAFEDFAVDADVAEFVDDDGKRRPCAFAMTWRISVVLPAPRKPVTMVQGTRVSEPVIRSFLQNRSVERGQSAALEHIRPAAPRQDTVGAPARAARLRPEQAHPRRVRRTRRSRSRCSASRRSGRACNWQGSAAAAPDFSSVCGALGRGGKQRTRARFAVRLSRALAGGADIDCRCGAHGRTPPAELKRSASKVLA
jgi:hypothetical protein